jgi:uncharacterized protein YkwD
VIRRFAALILTAVLAFGLVAPTAIIVPAAAQSIIADPATAAALISTFRRQNDLGSVVVDPELVALAQEQADAMARRGQMSHTVAGSFRSRMRGYGGGGAENIAVGQPSLAEVLAAWQNSTGHRANLLWSEATAIGIAVAFDTSDANRPYWALILGTRPQ